MDWKTPQALYLILPFGLAWLLLAIYSDRRKQRAREAFVSQSMWSRILPEESRFRFWLKQMLRVVAIVASLVALAGPRYGTEIEQIIPRGSDLYVLIDVSRSMLAEDVAPSRLGRAKADVSALVNRLQGERVGLIAFAGQAVVKCPLTVDYDSFRRALQELDPSSAPRGGTAIGDAIRKGLDVFQGNVERDQAMLIITDGDDQQSYPLEAATVASEHNVTIFTVGLGDSDQGARIPQKEDTKSFVEYNGEQVWSKLDGSLLEEIALKTSGVYVPAGTKAYDLGELYSSHLQGRRAKDAETQERTRRSEQYQFFLGIAVIALIIDLCISPFRKSVQEPLSIAKPGLKSSKRSSLAKTAAAGMLMLLFVVSTSQHSSAIEPHVAVREGLQLYAQEKYDVAREKFAAALTELEKNKSEYSAVAAFDEACAFHRKGDTEKARESYLRAGISQDRNVSLAAHFNLGALVSEQARAKAGEQPELVPAGERQAIIDHLMKATVAYRHCLELQPDHRQARSNLELVRLWIKFYSDKWRELDRQKRRDDSNLIVFLQYIIDTQKTLKEMVKNVPSNMTSDGFAELKQAQTELAEEIPTLKGKIEKDLRPPESPGANNGPPPSEEDQKQLEEGIRLLQSWADAANEQMSFSSRALGRRKSEDAGVTQQVALDELDKIWDAVIPFHPLIAKELADQTAIAKLLNPNDFKTEPANEASKDNAEPATKKETEPDEKNETPVAQIEKLELADDDLKQLVESQERTLRKTRLLAPKAEQELEQLESQPASETPEVTKKPEDSNETEQPTEVDPEEVKAGYRKAIELAPQAVEQMEAALSSLTKKDTTKAAENAEEARRILKEIQDAQPKNKQDQQQDQKKNDDQNKDSEDKRDDQKNDQQKPEDKKSDDDKSDPKKDEEKKSEKDQKQTPEQQPAKVSPDRIEEALRKVRERQEEKRDKDRELKAKILGRLPVDKDW